MNVVKAGPSGETCVFPEKMDNKIIKFYFLGT
jgi:hypothetical protein